MNAIDEVKQKTDICEIIGQQVKLIKAGRNFRAICPFHSEKNPSFYVYPERQSWHCFGACNTGGDVLAFIMKSQGLSFGEALNLLAQKAGVPITPKPKKQYERKAKEKLYEINYATAQYFHNLLLNSQVGEKARQYVTSRGLLPATVNTFQIGFSLPQWEALANYLLSKGYNEDDLLRAGLVIETEPRGRYDRFRNRLMFPIQDVQGRIVGFGARSLDDSLPKYLNSSQTAIFDKSSTLYGLNQAIAAIRKMDMVIIVEGYMDVLTAHQNNIKNIVAAMGISVTEQQIQNLKRLTKNVVLALDADTAGEEAALRAVNFENILGNEVKIIVLPSGQDPDDVIRQDPHLWQHLMEEAIPSIDFMFQKITRSIDLKTAHSKSYVTNQLLPIIAEIREPVRKAHYLQQLARLVNVSQSVIEATLSQLNVRKYRKEKPEPQDMTQPLSLASQWEEYYLALLLKYPDLRESTNELTEDHFDNSVHREIFIACQQFNDVTDLKSKIDPSLTDYVNSLANRNIIDINIEQKCRDCVARLKWKYAKELEARRVDIFASEAETKGAGADLAKLKTEGMEPSIKLREFHKSRQNKPRKN